MKTTTKTRFLSLTAVLMLSFSAVAQETTTDQFKGIPVEGEHLTEARNTFIDYHAYILDTGDFKFRKEIKKVKKEPEFLEYASTDNNIRISKYDYLRLVRRTINQSDTKNEFIDRMTEHFPDTENRFTNTLNLETIYDSARPKTFFGRFDELPRVR